MERLIEFLFKILRSAKVHYWLNTHVKEQNYRIWSADNLQAFVQTLLHVQKITVWCVLYSWLELLTHMSSKTMMLILEMHDF